MIELTEAQTEAIRKLPEGEYLQLKDTNTGEVYVLLPEKVYLQYKELLGK